MIKDKEKLEKFIKKIIDKGTKIKKRNLFLVGIAILVLNIVISIPISYLTKDYNHFAFAIGEAILIPIMIVGFYLIRLVINKVKM